MKGPEPDYRKNLSSGTAGGMVKCRMEEEGRVEPIDPERARRILREETPRKIERLRREFLEVYRKERGLARSEELGDNAA